MRTATVRRSLACALVALLGVLGTPSAHAVSGGTIALSGVHNFVVPLDLTSILPTTPFRFTGACTEVVAHATAPKPPATVGGCFVVYEGLYTGTCAVGSGTGVGVYVDSLGQQHHILVTFVTTGPVWRFVWNVTKPSTGETGFATGNGGWVPDPAQCLASAASTATAGAHTTIALI